MSNKQNLSEFIVNKTALKGILQAGRREIIADRY